MTLFSSHQNPKKHLAVDTSPVNLSESRALRALNAVRSLPATLVEYRFQIFAIVIIAFALVGLFLPIFSAPSPGSGGSVGSRRGSGGNRRVARLSGPPDPSPRRTLPPVVPPKVPSSGLQRVACHSIAAAVSSFGSTRSPAPRWTSMMLHLACELPQVVAPPTTAPQPGPGFPSNMSVEFTGAPPSPRAISFPSDAMTAFPPITACQLPTKPSWLSPLNATALPATASGTPGLGLVGASQVTLECTNAIGSANASLWISYCTWAQQQQVIQDRTVLPSSTIHLNISDLFKGTGVQIQVQLGQQLRVPDGLGIVTISGPATVGFHSANISGQADCGPADTQQFSVRVENRPTFTSTLGPITAPRGHSLAFRLPNPLVTSALPFNVSLSSGSPTWLSTNGSHLTGLVPADQTGLASAGLTATNELGSANTSFAIDYCLPLAQIQPFPARVDVEATQDLLLNLSRYFQGDGVSALARRGALTVSSHNGALVFQGTGVPGVFQWMVGVLADCGLPINETITVNRTQSASGGNDGSVSGSDNTLLYLGLGGGGLFLILVIGGTIYYCKCRKPATGSGRSRGLELTRV